jgi:hypothetical protein
MLLRHGRDLTETGEGAATESFRANLTAILQMLKSRHLIREGREATLRFQFTSSRAFESFADK